MVCHPHSSLHSPLTSPPAPLPCSLAPNEPPGTRSGKHKRDRQGPAPGSAGDKLTVHPASGPQESPYVLINSSVPVPRREPLPPLSSWTTSVGSRNGMADLACSGGAHKAGHRACGLSSAAPPTRSRPSSRESWCGCRHVCRAGEEERTAEPQGVLEKARSPLHRALHAGDARGLCPALPPISVMMARLPGEVRCPHSAPSAELTCFPRPEPLPPAWELLWDEDSAPCLCLPLCCTQ